MSELRVPLDYEQLTELSQLRLCLRAVRPLNVRYPLADLIQL